MIDFTRKVALVTGGSRGIGAATTRLLAGLGARVAFAWLGSEDAARSLEDELDGRVCGRRVDVREGPEVEAWVVETVDAWGGLDVVVANAGVWSGAPIQALTREEWDEALAVNLTGTFLTCRHAIPALKARGGGSIVVVSSTAGQRGEAGHSNYAAGKGGQIAFVKSLAVECAPAIRVNAVAPGWVDTDMSAGPIHGPERERILAEIPLKRVATADDVARAIAFLASDAARHVTGEVLNVNGGSVLCG